MRFAFLLPYRLILALLPMAISFPAGATDYPITIQRIDLDGGGALYAINDGQATLQVVLELSNSINVSSNRAWPVIALIPPYSQKTLAVLAPSNPKIPYRWDYRATVTISTAPAEISTSTSNAARNDVREEVQAELRRLLGPAARISRKLNGKP